MNQPEVIVPNWACPSCDRRMWFEITRATIDVSVYPYCPGCGAAMDRLDPLGEIEKQARAFHGRLGLDPETGDFHTPNDDFGAAS